MANRDDTIIVCPLAFEASALLKSSLRDRAAVQCCGAGPHSVRAWAETIDTSVRTVVLAGLAGALRSDRRAGSAHVVTAVVDDARSAARADDPLGAGRTPTLTTDGRPCVVVSVDRVVNAAEERRALAARSGADIVDLESSAFAKEAAARGWRWGIVRGISDDPDAPLPAGAGTWIDDAGGVQVGRVLASVARRPTSLIRLIHLRRSSITALREAARCVARLIE